MLVFTLTISAETYKVHFDTSTKSATSFTVQINSDNIVIGNNQHTLRRLGTITNSGFTFNSYMFSSSQRMFCVSTSTITVEVSPGRRVTGYILMIDQHAYLASKVY